MLCFRALQHEVLQEDAQLLNRVYSRLLEDAFFADSADEASKLPVSHPAMQGPQFLECTQLVEGWLRQLGERPLPLSQRAAEALAAVRMLGLEQYKQGEDGGTFTCAWTAAGICLLVSEDFQRDVVKVSGTGVLRP